MNRFYFLLFLSFFSVGFTGHNNDKHYKIINNRSFTKGEKLDFRVSYGLLNAAVATMTISDEIFQINGRPCYKMNIHGKSVGLFDLMAKINNNYGSFIDTAAIVPHKFYRYIEEGKYRFNEVVDFDHVQDISLTTKLDKVTKEPVETKKQEVPDNVQDMVSGFYFLRTLDFKKVKKGDIISINSFFSEEVYDFKVKFLGREEIKTKLGTFNALVLSPVMPANKLFDGENSVRVWLSDDSNKIPLKIKASMFVGSVDIELRSYSNARN